MPPCAERGHSLLRWIRNRRAFRVGVIAASAALSLALVTGAAAYIVSDDTRQAAGQIEASDEGRAPGYEAHLGDSIGAFNLVADATVVDPNERYAIDVANTLRDDEQRAREAEETARREAEAQATRDAEARQRAEEARVAAVEEAARVRAAAAAAEAAQAAATRAASAATASAATPAPARTAMAESSVKQALRSASSIQEAAAAAGWPAELLAKVERVVMCESSGRTTAVSPAGYVGLMQVAPWLHGPVPADAVGQLAQAYGVYLRQGWGAWPVCGR